VTEINDTNALVIPPEPRFMGLLSKHDGWYAGAEPKNTGNNPVLVFVPGLGQPAKSFWDKGELYGVNHLYTMAFNDGFRTAFAGFIWFGDKPNDMWVDGKLLSLQLKEICSYYKTESVIIIAHSKGGVDAQTAVVYYGAAPMVRRIITLSTPHWGSQLANLAYSSVGWPIADIMGQHSEGCFCMQTSYMSDYRRKTDSNVNNSVPIQTFAGSGDAPFFTDLWAGRQVLLQNGENDGVVTVKSANNPKGQHIGTLPLNHIQIQNGEFIWQSLKALICNQPQLVLLPAVSTKRFGVVLRGTGLNAAAADEEFMTELGVTALEIVISSGVSQASKSDFVLITPDGKNNTSFDSHEGIGGIKFSHLKIENPQAGKWSIKAPKGLAYLAVISLFGSFALYPDELNEAGQEGKGIKDLEIIMRVIKTYPDRYEVVSEQRLYPDEKAPVLSFDDGYYSLETTVHGELENGSFFQRNGVRPFIVNKNSNISIGGRTL